MQVNTNWEDIRLLDEESLLPPRQKRSRFLGTFRRNIFSTNYADEESEGSEDEMSDSSDEKEEPIHFPSIFDAIPDEVLLRIWTFLDPPSIGRAAQSCRRFHHISNDLPLWREIYKTKKWGENGIPIDGMSRTEFIQRFLIFQRNEKIREEQKILEKKKKKKKKRKSVSASLMKWTCYGRPCEWLSLLCIIALTILTVLKLDGLLQAPWIIVLIPLFFVLFQIIGAPLIYDLFASAFDEDFDEELGPVHNSCGPIFFFLAFIIPLQGRARTRRTFFLFLGSFVLWILLIVGKIHLPESVIVNWWVIFIPLLISLAAIGQVILWIGSKDVTNDERRLDRIIPSILFLLFIGCIIVIALKLDDILDWSWYLVLTPLWILKMMVICLPICLTVLAFISFYTNCFWIEDYTRWGRRPRRFCLTATLCTILFIIPLSIFEILLALTLEGDIEYPYALIFAPIFFVEAFGCLTCCVVNFALLANE